MTPLNQCPGCVHCEDNPWWDHERGRKMTMADIEEFFNRADPRWVKDITAATVKLMNSPNLLMKVTQ